MMSPQAREMTTLSKQEWLYIMKNYENIIAKFEQEEQDEANMSSEFEKRREIAVNQFVIGTYYTRNEDGSITYDIEQIREEMEEKLTNLRETKSYI